MAFQRSHTGTMNLALVLCLVAVMMNNIVVTVSGARQMNKNIIPSDDDEKGVNIEAEDPSKNKQLDKNQLPILNFPFPPVPLPMPIPRWFPGFPIPLPIPLPGRTSPTYYITAAGVAPEDNSIPGGVPPPIPPM